MFDKDDVDDEGEKERKKKCRTIGSIDFSKKDGF